MLCEIGLDLVLDGDGQNELVVGYTDRMVRAFRWTPDVTPSVIATSQAVPDKLPSNIWAGKFIIVENWLLAGQVRFSILVKCGLSCWSGQVFLAGHV